jgi:glycosyltransferase involved in cell wall biosynthesis
MKIRIVEAGNTLGLGGTELVIENFCRHLDKSRFEVTVAGFYESGVRGDILRNLGFRVVCAEKNPETWSRILADCDVLHWHGPGLLESAVFEPVRQHKPPLVIQRNVFGLADDSPYYDLVDVDIYVSQMILLRRVRQDGIQGQKHPHKRYVLYNPVDVTRMQAEMPSAAEVDQCRRELGVNGLLTLGRVGRPADEKFHPVAIRMMPALVKKNPRIKFLVVGFTDRMQHLAKRLGVQDFFVWIEPTPDLKTLLTYYHCMDVYVGTSAIGESFGLSLTEAMACGVPIVAISTPEQDNAQIELVDNGVNGLVVEAYPRLVALACRELLTNEPLRQKFGQNAQVKVQNFAAEKITRALENVIYQRLGFPLQRGPENGEPPLPLPWQEEMAADYHRRLRNVFARPRLDDRVRRLVRHYGGLAKLRLSRWFS